MGRTCTANQKQKGGNGKVEWARLRVGGFGFFYVFSFIYVFLDTKQNLTSNNVLFFLFFFFFQRRRVLSLEN